MSIPLHRAVTSNVFIKATFAGDMRRFALARGSQLKDLAATLRRTFASMADGDNGGDDGNDDDCHDCKLVSQTNPLVLDELGMTIGLQWIDDEGDAITIKTEADWTEAVQAAAPGTIKLHIITTETIPCEQQQQQQQQQQQHVAPFGANAAPAPAPAPSGISSASTDLRTLTAKQVHAMLVQTYGMSKAELKGLQRHRLIRLLRDQSSMAAASIAAATAVDGSRATVDGSRASRATKTPKPVALQPALLTQGPEPLTASDLASAINAEQKQMLGERLFPLLQQTHPEQAGKITGMLLEMDTSELLHASGEITTDEEAQYKQPCDECERLLGINVAIMCFKNDTNGELTLCNDCYWESEYYKEDENEDNADAINEYTAAESAELAKQKALSSPSSSSSPSPSPSSLPSATSRAESKLAKLDNAFVLSTKKKVQVGGSKPKDASKEILVRLNKLTLETFDVLAIQIKDLFFADDLDKVQELVKSIFDKAIDEEFFSMIYAKLCKYLAVATSPDDPKVEAIVGFRKTLLNCCQQEFEKATLADAAAAKADATKKAAAATAEKADGEAGVEKKELSKEEAAKARAEEREEGYARNKVKRHMLGNIRFIGELFKEDLVSSKIMMHCINHLMPNKNAEEENMENLCKLLDTAGGKWETQMLKAKKNKKQTAENEATVRRTFQVMIDITVRPGLSSRIKFAVLDILDLRDRKWKARTEAKGPKTIDQIHAEAQLEQLKIQQQSGGKGGGGHSSGGGRGSSGGGRRGRDGSSGGGGGRNSDGWTNVQAPRRAEKVDAGRFSGGGGSGGGSGSLRLGAPNLGGVRLGGGRSAKKTGASNPFAALAAGSGKRAVPARGGSPLLLPKQSSLLKSAKLSKSTSPTPAASSPGAGPAAEDVAPCKFTKEVLDRKINGCLDEYLSIVDLNEVKESIKEWGHPDATKEFALAAIKKGAEASEKHRTLFVKLFATTVGIEGGVPAATFMEAVASFLPSLPDLMYDAPRAHEYIGAFIAAAATVAPEVITVLLKVEAALKTADDDGGPELPLKLALATFAAAKAASSEAKMLELYASMGAPITSFMPDDKDRVGDLCDRAGVKALMDAPAAAAAAGGGGADTLESLLAADASNDQIFEWVDANVKARDADFVARLTELIVLETSKKTTCATAEDMQKPPTVEKEAAETEAVKNRSKALKVYTDGNDELQLHTLCAVQAAAVSKLKNPPGLLGRWFNHLYDMDVVLEDVFKTWEGDDKVSTSAKYPGKVLALTGANDLMDRLKNGAVEEDPGAE